MPENARLDQFVRLALARVCEIEVTAIDAEMPLEKLGIDSTRLLRLISHVQVDLQSRFAPEAVLDFFLAERVSDLVTLIAERLQNAY